MKTNKVDRKRFVRYKEGAELYSMCQSKFEDMAKDAGAVYKLNKLVLVNCDCELPEKSTLKAHDTCLTSRSRHPFLR